MTIDWWTLGIQTVNVAILVWLLQRFFWRPIAGIIEQRRATTESALAGVKAASDRAAAELAEVEKTRAGFAGERDAILHAAHDAAEKATAAALEDIGARVAAMEAAGTASIAAARYADEQAWTERASQLAATMAARLAKRLEGPVVQTSFLAWLLPQLRALPETSRLATSGVSLEAVSATPIAITDQVRTTGLIAEALGSQPTITYRTDPALIAGLELRGPHLLVTNSWQADIALLLAEARDDDRR